MAQREGLRPGEFRLITLGTGTGIPGQRRPPAHLVCAGETAVLLDTGPGTGWRLFDAGVSFTEIGALLYSHIHPDHFGGFVDFMFASRAPEYGRSSKLLVAGPEGLAKAYHGLKGVFGDWIELPEGMLEMRELSLEGSDGLTLGGLEVLSLPVDHTRGLGFRLTYMGRTVAYSGDSGPCENLVALARDADLFLCECAMPDFRPAEGHMTPVSAGRAARDAKVKKLVLTHLYPMVDPEIALASASKESGVEVVVARDLDIFTVE